MELPSKSPNSSLKAHHSLCQQEIAGTGFSPIVIKCNHSDYVSSKSSIPKQLSPREDLRYPFLGFSTSS